MKKNLNILPFLALLAIVVGSFSGCKGGSFFAASARATGKSDSPKRDLPAEPDVTFKNLEGQDVPLASLKGKVVIVNFWATYCVPCQTEIPWMIGVQQKYADKGVTFLGVAYEEEKSVVSPFVQNTKFDVGGQSLTMNYPIVLGNEDLAAKFGGLIGLPTTFVISRDGKIQKKYIGLADESDVKKEIETLL
jgi:thiol-disulfide isomerase/thioredoxin